MSETYPPVHGKARLTLTINGQSYIVLPAGLGVHGDCPKYVLKKPDGTRYVVQVSNRGVQCSCSDFLSRNRTDLACKHIKALNTFYMLRG